MQSLTAEGRAECLPSRIACRLLRSTKSLGQWSTSVCDKIAEAIDLIKLRGASMPLADVAHAMAGLVSAPTS